MSPPSENSSRMIPRRKRHDRRIGQQSDQKPVEEVHRVWLAARSAAGDQAKRLKILFARAGYDLIGKAGAGACLFQWMDSR